MHPMLQGDAATIAALLAVDPVGLGGVALRGPAGPQRDAWLSLLRTLLPAGTALRRVPLHATDTALLGGLDLGATLQAGRPVARAGLLAQAHGGVVLLAMAERMGADAAARFCAVLDNQEIRLERDGLTQRTPAHLGVVALDEGVSDEEQLPAALLERLAFRLVLTGADASGGTNADADPNPPSIDWTPEELAQARTLLAQVDADAAAVQALCAAAWALGVDSLRAPLFALRVARAAAALAGCTQVEEEHIALAARLVIAPRATRLPSSDDTVANDASAADNPAPADPAIANPQEANPAPAESGESQPQLAEVEPPTQVSASPAEPGTQDNHPPVDPPNSTQQRPLEERVLDAAQAAIPAGLLAALKIAQVARAKAPSAGRAGAVQKSQLRGRPIGARRSEPRAGQRLNLIETLRAAAPWQTLRRRDWLQRQTQRLAAPRIQVRKEDFHVTRFRQFSQTTTVFVVDASGSAALHRLAEAKGAVELLLADCYVRRDSVAVLAFRGTRAELLLPVTRSLARAKRSLAGLPGGGGTPLASGIDAARTLGEQIRRKGNTPILVFLTDGRGNIARNGAPGRAQAALDASDAARAVRLAGLTALVLDTSAQPHMVAQALAADMGARYLALPYAAAQGLSQAVRSATSLAAPSR
ncbi:magnesium chelatase subunit D [Rhodoferax sp.]|uniref:magnesium chelatase subunit D n=1 Tax=Rhodoferax sp. TaxID=50421 RepID=UPI0037848DF3